MSGQMKRVPSGGPHAMLDDETYALWQRQNGEAFDQLPQSVRDALKDTGIDTDNSKLLMCISKGIPETSIVAEIYSRDRRTKDGGPKIIMPDRHGRARLN